MNIVVPRDVLLWCAIINFGLLAGWSVFFMLSHEWLHRLYCTRFHLSAEQFDAINFTGILLYKIGIILFFVTPYVALRIVG